MSMWDVSPCGWYVVSYLLRFIGLTEEGNENLEKRFTTWENTIIVKAGSLDEAYDKAVQVAMKATEPYKGGPKGVDVQWVFEGISEVMPIYEDLEDGSEIMWANHGSRKLKTIRRWAKEKHEFHKKK